MITMLITMLGVGAILVIFGVLNMMGNISSLHSYHRHRVAPEDVKPFGKRVGLGNVLCGAGIIASGILIYVSEQINVTSLLALGGILLAVFMVAGLGISIFAIIKYNKGLF